MEQQRLIDVAISITTFIIFVLLGINPFWYFAFGSTIFMVIYLVHPDISKMTFDLFEAFVLMTLLWPGALVYAVWGD